MSLVNVIKDKDKTAYVSQVNFYIGLNTVKTEIGALNEQFQFSGGGRSGVQNLPIDVRLYPYGTTTSFCSYGRLEACMYVPIGIIITANNGIDCFHTCVIITIQVKTYCPIYRYNTYSVLRRTTTAIITSHVTFRSIPFSA
jgi:hypothetical protein